MAARPLSPQAQREAAHRHAEAACRDMAEMLPDGSAGEGYDLSERPDGRILVECGFDVRFHVDRYGEVDYS